MLRWKQLWQNWEPIRCLARSLWNSVWQFHYLFYWELVYPNTMCSGITCERKKRLSNISAKANIIVISARQRVRCAKFLLRNKQIRFSRSVTKGFIFLKKHKCTTGCQVLNIPFGDQKPTILLFGADCTYCFVETWVEPKKKQKQNLQEIFRRSQSTTPEPIPKMAKLIPLVT